MNSIFAQYPGCEAVVLIEIQCIFIRKMDRACLTKAGISENEPGAEPAISRRPRNIKCFSEMQEQLSVLDYPPLRY